MPLALKIRLIFFSLKMILNSFLLTYNSEGYLEFHPDSQYKPQVI